MQTHWKKWAAGSYIQWQERILATSSSKRGTQWSLWIADHVQRLIANPCQFSHQLLFQRLLAAAREISEDLADIFMYELCNRPSALFDYSGLLREAKKPVPPYVWKAFTCLLLYPQSHTSGEACAGWWIIVASTVVATGSNFRLNLYHVCRLRWKLYNNYVWWVWDWSINEEQYTS